LLAHRFHLQIFKHDMPEWQHLAIGQLKTGFNRI
jgi:hypothetical protein